MEWVVPFDSVLIDLRHAIRALGQRPASRSARFLVLALGTGATTADPVVPRLPIGIPTVDPGATAHRGLRAHAVTPA
jgi:hypothetical protein